MRHFSFPDGIQCRRITLPADEARVREIAGEIWQGGASALLEEQYGIIGGKPWQEWQSQEILNWIAAADSEAYALTSGGETIAFCSLQIDRERSLGTVGYNGVAKAFQGKGLGSLMMEFVMQRFAEEKLSYAAVLVADNPEHAPARRVYEKHGFKSVYALHYLFQKLS